MGNGTLGTENRHRDWVRSPAPDARQPGTPAIPSQVFEAELREIVRRRGDSEKKPAAGGPHPDLGLVGLAISGGGIRSATFALGVCQSLASEEQLERFDYLSTVSGGGYLGSSLSWLLSRKALESAGQGAAAAHAFDLGAGFPYGREDPESRDEPRDTPWQGDMLRYLREHGKYLTPGGFITILSAVGVFLRGVVLNLLVWLPILVAVFVALFWLEPVASGDRRELLLERAGADAQLSQWPLSWALQVVLVLLAVFVVSCVVYSVATYFARGKDSSGTGSRYPWRRHFETFCHGWLLVAIVFLVLGSLPVAASALGTEVAERGSVVAVLLGLVSGAASFFQAGRNGESRVPVGVMATAGAVLLLYGVLFLAYRLAFTWFDGGAVPWILLLALVVAFLTGWFVNLNYIGLHRFYRDRLMETFMPQVGDALAGRTGPTRAGDSVRMSTLKGANHKGLYHLVDTNLVLVNSTNRKLRMRGGDSFVLSPCYCGSTATGYLPTESFIDDQMTLATAMAISGAAAHPNTGAGGTGPTRAKAVSLLMALLNVRLGYWIPNPKRPGQRARTPSHFLALLYEVLPWGYREKNRYLQISDGGHFENLALYELVRRRCRVIVVLDGAADPGFAFGDLQVATRRIAADFGALIEWDDDRPFEDMIPSHDAEYPQDTKVAERGHALATISYPNTSDPETGREIAGGTSTLVYVKSTMIRDRDRTSLRVRGYRSAHDTFPDQSTADQFFDEEQFEAYRDLGYQLGAALLADGKMDLRRHIERARST